MDVSIASSMVFHCSVVNVPPTNIARLATRKEVKKIEKKAKKVGQEHRTFLDNYG